MILIVMILVIFLFSIITIMSVKSVLKVSRALLPSFISTDMLILLKILLISSLSFLLLNLVSD